MKFRFFSGWQQAAASTIVCRRFCLLARVFGTQSRVVRCASQTASASASSMARGTEFEFSILRCKYLQFSPFVLKKSIYIVHILSFDIFVYSQLLQEARAKCRQKIFGLKSAIFSLRALVFRPLQITTMRETLHRRPLNCRCRNGKAAARRRGGDGGGGGGGDSEMCARAFAASSTRSGKFGAAARPHSRSTLHRRARASATFCYHRCHSRAIVWMRAVIASRRVRARARARERSRICARSPARSKSALINSPRLRDGLVHSLH